MSKPYSPSSAPEFAVQHDYSDILATSIPPAKPLSLDLLKPLSPNLNTTRSESITDPWASTTSTEQPDLPAQKLSEPTGNEWSQPSTKSVPTAVHQQQDRQVIAVAEPLASVVSIDRDRHVEAPVSEVSIAQDTPSITAKDLAVNYCERGNKSLAAKNYAQAKIGRAHV